MRNFSNQSKRLSNLTLTGLVLMVMLFSSVGQALAGVDHNPQADPVEQQEETGELVIDQTDISQSSGQWVDTNQVTTFSISMPQLDNREREIIVYLPPTYLSSDGAYSVIYLQNAQEVFIHPSDTQQAWLINPTLFEFFNQAFEGEAIIVGIKSDFDHYWDEYSPWTNTQMHSWVNPSYAERTEGGEGEAYLEFIIETLKPEIDHRFRTLPEPETTAIGGYDMGGFISIYAGLTRSDVFSKVVALSPAIWFAEKGGTWLSDNQLLHLVFSANVPENVTFYFEIGDLEKRTDLDVHPDIDDRQGDYITYAQAYTEGSAALINAMVDRGLTQNHIIASADISAVRSTIQYEELTETILPSFLYHFPLFLLQEWTVQGDFLTKTFPDYRNRRVWVYLPPGYFTSDQSYPVLYVMDALDQFNPYNSSTIPYYYDWKTDEKLNDLYDPVSFPGIIVVGIEHHPTTYRWSEYNRFNQYNMDNWVDDGSEVVLGEGDAFLNFIIKTLKPTIDRTFRTLPDRNNTAIGGGSRGAYLALNAGLTQPEIFSKVMAMSPAIWMAEGGLQTDHPIWLESNRLIKWINTNTIPTNVMFYLYIGGEEYSTHYPYPLVYRTIADDSKITYPAAYLEGAQAVKAALTAKGITPIWRYQADGEHLPLYWRNYLVDALQVFGFY